MNAVLSAAGSWAVAVAIAAPIIILFWYARRTAPAGQYDVDYSVGRRSRPPADSAATLPVPAPHGAADAPVPANPAALAPPAEPAVPAASIVTLPTPPTLPPEPASVAPAVPTPAPAGQPPAPVLSALPPTPAPVVKPEPPKPAPTPVVKAPPTPAPARAAVPAPKPEPVAPAPTPEPEPAPAPVETPVAAQAAPDGENDDFSRLYGPDAASIAALQAAGILTYRQLAGASIEHLKEILAAAGASGVDPSTWPQQGRFAAGGKWKILDARFKG